MTKTIIYPKKKSIISFGAAVENTIDVELIILI